MQSVPGLPDLTSQFATVAILAFGYPLLILFLLEIARANREQRPFLSDILRQLASLVLPFAAIWFTLSELAGLGQENWMVRSAETGFALSGLYVLLRVGQAILMAMIDQSRAPKMLFDILRIGLAVIWGAVAVSRIWAVDLGQLFAAMGVGSIVLGFALQEFLGNLLSGLGLLSARKFGIGDFLRIENSVCEVVDMDWRTVTLIKDNNDILVVANSTLAKTNLTIVARAGKVSFMDVFVMFALDIPPEVVRDAAFETLSRLPALIAAGNFGIFVDTIRTANNGSPGGIVYRFRIPNPVPGANKGPVGEYFSQFWYVAQRRGIHLTLDGIGVGAPVRDAAARLEMLMAAGAFRGEQEALSRLAEAAAFRMYRRREIIAPANEIMSDALLVIRGSLAVILPNGDTEIRIEAVETSQLLVLQETLTGKPVPVKVVAEGDTDILAIPASVLQEVMESHRAIARDVGALTEARRLAIHPPTLRRRPASGVVAVDSYTSRP